MSNVFENYCDTIFIGEDSYTRGEYLKALTDDSLNLCLFLKTLATRLGNETSSTIKTKKITEFMNTLDGEAKCGANNGVKRSQYFLNACSSEYAICTANPGRVRFIEHDHDCLYSGGTGKDIPDCCFTDSFGNLLFTFDVKMYFNQQSYFSRIKTTNFHKADYAVLYIINEHKWYFSIKAEGYQKLYTKAEISEKNPNFKDFKLPTQLVTVQFKISDDLKDNQVPEVVDYCLYNNISY